MAHRLSFRLLSVLALTSCLTACGGDDSAEATADAGGSPASDAAAPETSVEDSNLPSIDGDCDPLVPEHCGLPFPSNIWLKKDPTHKNPSGYSVRFGGKTLPVNCTHKENGVCTQPGKPAAPALFYDLDGFSTGQAPMTYLEGATEKGLPDPDHIPDSIEKTSPTILLDTSTEVPELVPHWAGLDQTPTHDVDGKQVWDPKQSLLMIRAAIRPKDATRYVVAVRNIVDASGKKLAPSPAFKALRDGKSTDSRQKYYDKNIFAALEKAGIDRKDLQIAWDYTTASKEGTTRRLVSMRDDALKTVGDLGPKFTFNRIEPCDRDPRIRIVYVDMEVPLYLTTSEYAQGDELPSLALDDKGLPKQNGTMKWPVLIVVPVDADKGPKLGLLQNGHGLFGSSHEGACQSGLYLDEYAATYHWIPFGTTFYGFGEDDETTIAAYGLAGRPEVLRFMFERQHQGTLIQLLAMRMMMGRVAKEGIKDDKGNVVLDPKWIDPDIRAYRGDSQGGIMGTTYMALSTDVTRGLLGENGMPYNLLLNRSQDWPTFETIFKGAYIDGIDRNIMLGLAQMWWDRTEPNGYAPYMSKNMLPNTPAHHVLMHVGLGDHQVPPLGAEIAARTMGSVLLESNDPKNPVAREVFGIPRAKAPVKDENVLVEYDFGLPPAPLGNLPATEGCDPHDRIRVLTPSYTQSDEFFRTGKIPWKCDGLCSCDDDHEEEGCPGAYVDQCCDGKTSEDDPKCPAPPPTP